MPYNVTSTKQNYKAAYKEHQDRYPLSARASALFYSSDANEKGVRIEAPEILKEFVDNVSYGRDLVGTLFYRNIDHLNDKTRYNVINSDRSVKDADAVVIVQFFGSVQDQGTFYAEFVGRDPARTVSWLEDGTKHEGGTWRPLELSTSTAFVEKRSNEREVNITIVSIDKKVSFDLPARYATGKNISVWGNLSTNDITKIKKDPKSVVDYNNDRILFYPSKGNKDLTAVFFPSDATALGDVQWVSAGEVAVWDDYDEDD